MKLVLKRDASAEGAEEILERHWIKETGKPIGDMTKSHREYCIAMMHEFAAQRQPTDEGAENVLRRVINETIGERYK